MSKGLKALYSGIEVNTKDYGNCTAYTPDCIDIIEKELQALEILKKYLYYDNKNHAIKMKEVRKSIYNFDYEDLKEVLGK